MRLPYAITIPMYSDPGHAWGAVKRSLLDTLDARGTLPMRDITPYSYQRGGMVYLEEDRDLTAVCNALRREGFAITFEKRGSGESSWVRSLPAFSPTLAPMPGGKWLVFARGFFGPMLLTETGCLQPGDPITDACFYGKDSAHLEAVRRDAYRPIRAGSKRAHDLCLARGYTYSQPVRQRRS